MGSFPSRFLVAAEGNAAGGRTLDDDDEYEYEDEDENDQRGMGR